MGGGSTKAGGGSEFGAAPSAVYAPSAAYAPSQAYSTSGLSTASAAARSQAAEVTLRKATRKFEPEGSGELRLDVGDTVKITHDPDEGETKANLHRWVYGTNESTQDN